MDDMDDIINDFLIESQENLDRLDRELVSLEERPNDRETLASIFRTIHTIKGSCSFLGLSKLEKVTHVGESLLSKLRDGELLLDKEKTSALLALVDAVRAILAQVESTRKEGDTDYSQLIARLTALYKGESAAVPLRPPPPRPELPQAELGPSVVPIKLPPEAIKVDVLVTPAETPVQAAPPPKLVEEVEEQETADLFGELLAAEGKVSPDALAKAVLVQKEGDPRRVGELLVEQGAIKPQDVPETLKKQGELRGGSVTDNTIRVDVSLLDKLMNLVGELVLARNQILQYSSSVEDTAFAGTSQRLNLITTELQEGVMKTRMQAIGTLWSKFPRLVRDLAVSCGKEVRIEMEGKETELDKTLIEALKDPLTHIVRNSIDHGIESPGIRAAKGKAREGRLFMRAFHEGGQVNIEITDDGAGIDLERVKDKALKRGLITHDQASRMTDREVLHLIFLPGFSTAEQVTNISGRGVGMDVVRTNIEKIGGQVDLQSRPGEGTTIKVKIPLTLAIIPALIVTSGGERFTIPQVNLLELVRLENNNAAKGVETILGVPVYRLRGNLLPLIFLNRELSLIEEKGETAREAVNLVVLQADDRQFGLVVDEINDTQEIVVKPMGKLLKGLTMFAGATIMGDGKVALILDVMGIAQRARVVSEMRDRALQEKSSNMESVASNKQSLLLFEVSEHGRMVIPLSMVARLEEFAVDSCEYAGEQEVIQYRGSILPLIRLSYLLPERRMESRGDFGDAEGARRTVQVVVLSCNGQPFGLVVGRIVDVVEESLAQLKPGTREGVVGTVVIQGRVTQLLDVEWIVRMANPTFFEHQAVA